MKRWEMMKEGICPKWHENRHRLEKRLSTQPRFIEAGRLERKVRAAVTHSSCWESLMGRQSSVWVQESYSLAFDSCHGHHISHDIEQVMELFQALVASPIE